MFILDSANEIYEEYFPEVTRIINRANRGLTGTGVENLTGKMREKMLYFLVDEEELEYESGYFLIPETVRYIESAYYRTREIELCKSNQEYRAIINNVDAAPSLSYPVGLQVGERIKVSPLTIDADVTLTYLRKPIPANWAYIIVGNNPQVNPDATDYRDIDLHPSEENNMVMKVLRRMGINLKDQELLNYTMQQENIDFNQDNQP